MFALIPPWVPFLLLGLLFLGYRQSVTRVVKPRVLLAVALGMLGFSLYGVASAFGASAMVLLLWAAGYLLAAVGGARRVAASGLARVGGAVRVPGSWWPMVLILGIFTAKFALGFAAGVHAPVLQSSAFIATMSLVLGALSGGFGARAFAVHRVASGAQAA